MISDKFGESGSHTQQRRLPSLLALRCFEAAARLENFSRAADELHVTHGAVSRAVRLLEEDLGLALFERRSRRVYLTADGRMLAHAVSQGLDLMRDAVAELRARARQNQRWVLSCEPTLLMRWLIPRWGDFQARYPQHTVHLVAGGGAVEWGRGIDLAIRRNDFDCGRNVQMQLLCAERMGPVCHPDRLTQFFASQSDGGLALRGDATLLHSTTRPKAWEDWWKTRPNQPSAQIRQAQAGVGLVLEHFYLSLQAAAAGLGVAMGPQLLVQDDIAAGRLVAPLGFVPDGSHYCLLAVERWGAGSVQQLLADWIEQQMKS